MGEGRSDIVRVRMKVVGERREKRNEVGEVRWEKGGVI